VYLHRLRWSRRRAQGLATLHGLVIRFRLGPFPVTVQLWFLLTAVLLGGASASSSPAGMAIWVAVVFISVLGHELGHAIFGKALGGDPEITLVAFGGLTYPRLRSTPKPLARIGLALAGPVAGLLLGGVAIALGHLAPPDPGSPVAQMLYYFKVTSIAWAVLNLLPVLPLDGGQMMQAAIEGVRKKPSVAAAGWVSAVFAAAVAVYAFLVRDSIFLAIWFAMFAFQNINLARSVGGGRAQPKKQEPLQADAGERLDVERELERARKALAEEDVAEALRAAAALEEGIGAFRQAAGLRLRAAIELSRGDNQAASLFAGRSFSLWQSADAALVAALASVRSGEPERAKNWLRRAVEAGAPVAAVREDPELGPLAG